jgi:hypothetical protein
MVVMGDLNAMIVPAFFYGKYSDVRARTARLVEKASRGKYFTESLSDGRTIDTTIVTLGYLNLMTHRDLSITQSHFHFTLLRSALTEAEGMPDTPLAERLFGEILNKEWGPLVFADPADGWLGTNLISDNGHRRRQYIHAVLAHLRPLDREGERYIGQNGALGTFWQANGALRNALAEEGIPAQKEFDANAFRFACRNL